MDQDKYKEAEDKAKKNFPFLDPEFTENNP